MFPRLSHLWLDAGYRGEEKGRGWVEKVLGWSVDLVERPRKPAPEDVLKSWAEQWRQEGVEVDWERLLPPKGFPRFYHAGGWSGGRSLLDRAQQTYELMDYERLTATSDAFIIYVRGEPPDGEALGSLMRLFGRFLAELP